MKTPRNRLLWVSTLIILVVTMTPGNGKFAGNYLDKIGHFIVFFFLAINICFSFKRTDKFIAILFWGILFGFLTEFIQQFIPGRNMDIYDAFADTLGIVIGYFTYEKSKGKLDKVLLKLGA